MKLESGNLNAVSSATSQTHGWVVGSFIDKASLRCSNNVEVKWAHHEKGLRKSGGVVLEEGTRTLVILLKGKWITTFPTGEVNTLSVSGDYLLYEASAHENEALEDTDLIVIRWKEL